MYREIKDFSSTISGYTFRGAVISDPEGNLRVFQAKDLVQGVPITDTSKLTTVSLDLRGYSGHLQNNDVLMVSRGMKAGNFRSTIFKSSEQNVIASSSVHVIRVVSAEVLPEYLSYYLNSSVGQEKLSEIVTGSYIGVISRRALEKIKIPIPDLHKQKAIIDLYQNIQMQQKILDRKNQLKQQIIEATFTNITKHHD